MRGLKDTTKRTFSKAVLIHWLGSLVFPESMVSVKFKVNLSAPELRKAPERVLTESSPDRQGAGPLLGGPYPSPGAH